MSNAIQDRLTELRKLQTEAQKQPEKNKAYLEDLEVSIKHCEDSLQQMKWNK